MYTTIKKKIQTAAQTNRFSQSKTFTNCTVLTSALETTNGSSGRVSKALRWKGQSRLHDMKDLEIIKEIYENKLAGLLWGWRIIGEENRLFNGHTL